MRLTPAAIDGLKLGPDVTDKIVFDDDVQASAFVCAPAASARGFTNIRSVAEPAGLS